MSGIAAGPWIHRRYRCGGSGVGIGGDVRGDDTFVLRWLARRDSVRGDLTTVVDNRQFSPTSIAHQSRSNAARDHVICCIGPECPGSFVVLASVVAVVISLVVGSASLAVIGRAGLFRYAILSLIRKLLTDALSGDILGDRRHRLTA